MLWQKATAIRKGGSGWPGGVERGRMDDPILLLFLPESLRSCGDTDALDQVTDPDTERRTGRS